MCTFLSGCSQDHWDDTVIEELRVYTDKARANTNNKQYKLAEKQLLQALIVMSEHRNTNVPSSQKIHTEWIRLQYLLAEHYFNHSTKVLDSKDKKTLIEKSLNYYTHCLTNEKIQEPRFELTSICSLRKGIALIELNQKNEAIPFLLASKKILFEPYTFQSNKSAIYELMSAFYLAYDGGNSNLSKQELDVLYTTFVRLVDDFSSVMNFNSKSDLPERARLIVISLRSGHVNMMNTQIQKIQYELGKEYINSDYHKFISLIEAIQLDFGGKTEDAINILEALDEDYGRFHNIYKYNFLTKYYLKSGKLGEANKSFERLKKWEESTSSITLLSYLDPIRPTHSEHKQGLDDLEKSQLESYRNRMTKELNILGFDKFKSAYSKRDGFEKMSYSFFSAFSSSFNFAVVRSGTFEGTDEDIVFFTHMSKVNSFTRRVIYRSQNGLVVRPDTLKEILEENVLFFNSKSL